MLRSLASNIKKQGSGDGTRRYISKKLWEYITEFHLTEAKQLHASHLVREVTRYISYIRQRPPKAENIKCTHQWPGWIGARFRQSGGKEGKEIFGYCTVCKRYKLEQKQGTAATPECGPANLQEESPTTPRPVAWCPLGRRPSAWCQL